MPSRPAEQALTGVFAALPGWFSSGWQLAADVPAVWALLLVVVALVQSRTAVVWSALFAIVCAVLLSLVAAWLVTDDWPAVAHLFGTDGQQPAFPAVRLGISIAVIVAMSADIARFRCAASRCG